MNNELEKKWRREAW